MAETISPVTIALLLIPWVFQVTLSRDEFQGYSVDAIAQACRLWAIVEHVAEMSAATAAMHFLPDHTERCVGIGFHAGINRTVEDRPAGPRIELGVGGKQRQIATGTGESAFAMLLVKRAGEGTLGVLLTEHGILLWREQLLPFLRGVGDFECLGGCIRAPAPSQRAKSGSDGGGRDNGSQTNLASRNHGSPRAFTHNESMHLFACRNSTRTHGRSRPGVGASPPLRVYR